MAKGQKTDIQNLEQWLLDFEKMSKKPIVISLIINRGTIEFHSCVDMSRYFEDHDSEIPAKEVNEAADLIKQETRSYVNYIN